MIIEAVMGSALFGELLLQTNKSMNLDESAMKKNSRAFTRMSESQEKLKKCREKTKDKLMICAKRKYGICNAHIKMFQEQFETIRTVEFTKGQGIEEILKLEEIMKKYNSVSVGFSTGTTLDLSTSQSLITYALFGIGGLMVKESKNNLKMASKTMAQANAISAQIDSMCIVLDGLAKHAEIITELLQNLGMLYMKSIRTITDIISKNGKDSERYTQMDIESINMSVILTRVIYRIINTPMIDENGNIEQESLKVIEDGRRLLQEIE